MRSSELDAAQVAIELFTDLCVQPPQTHYFISPETISTLVRVTMKEVMKKPCQFKILRLSVEAELIQLTSKIIKHLFWSCGLVFVQGIEHIFSALLTINQVKTITMAM